MDIQKSSRNYNFDEKVHNEYVSSGEDEEEEKKESLNFANDIDNDEKESS